jgi:hypothetical protein
LDRVHQLLAAAAAERDRDEARRRVEAPGPGPLDWEVWAFVERISNWQTAVWSDKANRIVVTETIDAARRLLAARQKGQTT